MREHRRYKPRDFHFAQRLLTLRKQADLTQEEVALQLGVASKTIRNWEGGSYYPSDVHLRKLTELYLAQNVFASGSEEDEVRALWEQLREGTSHRTGNFDEQWFAALFTQWQIRSISHESPPGRSQQHEQPRSPEQRTTAPLPAVEPENQGLLPSPRLLLGDWSEALDVSAWYGRTDELAELERWLLTDRCRIVAVLGMGGIGKTPALPVCCGGPCTMHLL